MVYKRSQIQKKGVLTINLQDQGRKEGGEGVEEHTTANEKLDVESGRT